MSPGRGLACCLLIWRAGNSSPLGCSTAGVVAWSLWEGYLKMPSGAALQELLAEHQISLTSVHTLGHASVFDLRRLVEALGPKRVVPIHSDAGDRVCEFFPRAERHADGDSWQVGSE